MIRRGGARRVSVVGRKRLFHELFSRLDIPQIVSWDIHRGLGDKGGMLQATVVEQGAKNLQT